MISDVSDAGRIQPLVPPTTVLLPVLYKPTKQALAAAERTYGIALEGSGANRHPLAVIEDALKLEARRRKAAS